MLARGRQLVPSVANCGKYDTKDKPACWLNPRRTATARYSSCRSRPGPPASEASLLLAVDGRVLRVVFAEAGRFRAEPLTAWEPLAPTDHRDEPLPVHG